MRVGIVGGGLMGREAASPFGRWFALDNFPVQAELVGVCDLQEKLLDWQMWAAFAVERAGQLGDRFGCVTADEAVFSHELFAAALESHGKKSVVALQ